MVKNLFKTLLFEILGHRAIRHVWWMSNWLVSAGLEPYNIQVPLNNNNLSVAATKFRASRVVCVHRFDFMFLSIALAKVQFSWYRKFGISWFAKLDGLTSLQAGPLTSWMSTTGAENLVGLGNFRMLQQMLKKISRSD